MHHPSIAPRLCLVHEGHVDTLAARHLPIYRRLIGGIVEVIEHDARLGGVTSARPLAIAIALVLTSHHTCKRSMRSGLDLSGSPQPHIQRLLAELLLLGCLP